MRRFIIIGHRARTDHRFKLDDVCGGAGRLDVLLRCVNSAFFLSHAIRKDAEVYLILQGQPDPPKCIRMVGDELRYLNPDERSTASLMRNALAKPLGNVEIKASPGIYISRKSLASVVEELSSRTRFFYAREDGQDIQGVAFPKDATFVLGDDRDLTEEEEALVLAREPDVLSLGPLSLHADHCVVLIHNRLDRAGE